MKLISLGKVNIFTLLLFIAALIKLASSYIFTGINSPPAVSLTFISGFSTIFYFILEIIFKRQKTSRITNRNLQTLALKLNINPFNEEQLLFDKIFLYVTLISFLRSIAALFEMISNSNSKTIAKFSYEEKSIITAISKIIEFSLNSLFNKLLLKYNLYIHHLVYWIVIIIGTMTILIPLLIGKSYQNMAKKLILTSGFALHSLIETIQRWLMFHKYISPFKILYLSGILTPIFVVIVAVFFHYTKLYKINLKDNDDYFNQGGQAYIRIFIYLIYSFIHKFCSTITIKYLGTTFWSTSDYSALTLSHIIKLFSNNIVDYWIVLCGYLIIDFGSILYNEIIILHLCRLDKYTKLAIEKRSNDDTSLCIDELDISKDSNDNIIEMRESEDNMNINN